MGLVILLSFIISLAVAVHQASYYKDSACSGPLLFTKSIEAVCTPQTCTASSTDGTYYTVSCPSTQTLLGVTAVQYTNSSCDTIISTTSYATVPACIVGNTYACMLTSDGLNSTIYHNTYANTDCTGTLVSSIYTFVWDPVGCDSAHVHMVCTKASMGVMMAATSILFVCILLFMIIL